MTADQFKGLMNVTLRHCYTAEIIEPKNKTDELLVFAQMIINNIEAGNIQEALLLTVDLRNDIKAGLFEVN